MDKLRKYIRKEIQSLHEQKSYPVPLELMDVLKGELEMRPLKRYINNIKAVNSIPPSYKIFLHNGQDFDVIYLGDQMNNFKVRIADKEYDLLVMDGGDEGGVDDDAAEPDEDEPADTEPESDMI